MNEFGAKKLGEVLAFSRVGNDTLEKGYEGFRKLFSDAKLEDLKKGNSECEAKITAVLETIEASEKEALKNITETKAKATAEKLFSMRDLYVKNEWGNPAELSEWLGFFEGAAVVHWTLVKGIAEGLGDKALETLSDESIIFHEEQLKTASLSLYNIGKEKSGKDINIPVGYDK